MTNATLTKVHRLAREAEKAARLVERNRFLIETYISLAEARAGKGRSSASVDALFKRLKV